MEDTLARLFRDALAQLPDLPADFDPETVEVDFEVPGNPDHGDLATNVAMKLAKPLRRAPRQIAEALVANLNADPKQVAAVEIAGPGFINVRLAKAYLTDGLADILASGDDYGRTEDGAGKTAIVEFVSANPTGPLTVGHGRNAVLGDTVATLLTWTGWDVTREYYFNDAGRQMRVLGESVRARYQQIVDPEATQKTLEDGTVVPASFPDEGYRGAYITDVARALFDARGDALMSAETEEPFRDAARDAVFAEIKATLERMSIHMDSYFTEQTVYDNNAVWDVVEKLKAQDLAYEKDDATWFATGKLGKTVTRDGETKAQDTVLIKASGEPTYRLPDIAYHLDKLARGYERIVDVFGADHIATVPDVIRGVRALAGDEAAEKIDVLIYQFVTLVRSGQPVKMSTRKANYVTLDDLMDEVNAALAAQAEPGREASEDAGADVVRYFFLMRSPNTHLEFDLDQATETAEKNPVFYLQYAHARIASIIDKATEAGITASGADLSTLTHESAVDLTKGLLQFPDEIRGAAEAMGPHRLATYLREVATLFNRFYRDCHILGEPADIAGARLALAMATKTVLKNGLSILGLSAPEEM
ncbi:arginine--tRNA ligase [Rubricoccus marinus]|uniref:Arginine--tRNA ligase n=1 Tax=Rubricoccus marinus TaxID=716817 RepID=A0A259TVN3_9BACT|nr:arginine--tRNA ligase [Rubricoccus marinus]OZC01832.1 arginine--tRNA ligase [Rubricoccus marinus]